MKPPRRPSRRLKVRKCFARSRTEMSACEDIRGTILAEAAGRRWPVTCERAACDVGSPHPPVFRKCMKRKGFKSFVLKVCETKGFTDAFLRKCVNLKSLGDISASFKVSKPFGGPFWRPSERAGLVRK